jgi:glycosyltransferase involved in cell wall biosynthesis
MMEGISVLMPTYRQANFISRAIESLRRQTFSNWELIVINDGSDDHTSEVMKKYKTDDRIRFYKNDTNEGLGACLNKGISLSAFSCIAYLPSDDIWYADHLEALWKCLAYNNDCVLAYSGVRHHYNKTTSGAPEGFGIQLVQVLHRKKQIRWTERSELVTDDLHLMYWDKLKKYGKFTETGSVTCDWVNHPHQRHKIIREPEGGLNHYRQYYKVNQLLNFKSSVGNRFSEPEYYRKFISPVERELSENCLKILLAGELSYNPERLLALEEQGHKLYGLWMKKPYWYNNNIPDGIGNIEEIPFETWQETIEKIQPDVIYALLNWQAVPLAWEVLKKNHGIPFIWHFKEGPFICIEKGLWPQLIDLHTLSDGQIYSSPEMKEWFGQFIPVTNSLVLDGDLPKKDWFTSAVSGKISETDGEIHTVVPGRPIGLHPPIVKELAEHKIHLHFYGDYTHGTWKEWIEKCQSESPGYLHLHPNCSQDSWVNEFSKYDAGWLHCFRSSNNRDLMRASWDDLNYPARMATLAMAGLPMIQGNNSGHTVAMQSLIREKEMGLFFDTIPQLATQLRNSRVMEEISHNVWKNRMIFSFDYHVTELINFFRKTIDSKIPVQNKGKTISAGQPGSIFLL